MVFLGFLRGHKDFGVVAVSTRADHPAYHHRCLLILVLFANIFEKPYRLLVRPRKFVGRVAEPRAPVRVRTPRRALQNNSYAASSSDIGVIGELLP